MSIEISPCPFCGASGLGSVLGGLSYDGTLDLDGGLGMVRTGENWYAVRCRECEAAGPRVRASRAKAVEKAIAAWNRRTIWA